MWRLSHLQQTCSYGRPLSQGRVHYMDHQVVKRPWTFSEANIMNPSLRESESNGEIDFVYDDITVVLGEIEIMFCKIYFEIFPRRT